MAPTDLQTAIKDDLYNELRWLLCAATQWQACHVGSGGATPHMKVYAMDSTFLHARALYEFFTATRTNNPDRLTWNDFSLPQGLSSTKYSNLISDLHGRALHLNKNRSSYQAIKNEVVAIATDVLNLWDTFAIQSQVQSFKTELDGARRLAVQDANRVAMHSQISPIFN